MDVVLVASVVAIAATAVSVAYTLRWRRRALDAELQSVIMTESWRHEVCMYRHMLRTLRVDLPHDPTYDGPEGNGG